MRDFQLPLYPELINLSGDERRSLMYISRNPEHFEVECSILRALAFAVATKSSDVHFNAKQINGVLSVFINIRTKEGFANYAFNSNSSDAKHFETKLLQLTNNTVGGTQAEIISARFSLDFPHWWAKTQCLELNSGESYKTDVRVQFQKTFSGFSIVCRILDQQRTPKLSEMGLSRALEILIRRIILEPSGLILVSGPTGSGKTTLLNAMLCELNDGSRSIFTIENPVEFRLKGDGPITQVQTHGQVSFASGLRSALRSDPDVILIGEIRDSETMEVALQAAQTGHLVLATIHASGASQTISRMLDLTKDKSRDSFRVSDTLKLVLAQRLIDKYVSEPKERLLSSAEKDWFDSNAIPFPKKLTETVSTTKVGLNALVEAIEIDHSIKKIIRTPNFLMEDIHSFLKNQLQYETLAMCGLRYVEMGEAKLSDCLVKLETLQLGDELPPLRLKLALKYGLSFSKVSSLIDEFVELKSTQCHIEEVADIHSTPDSPDIPKALSNLLLKASLEPKAAANKILLIQQDDNDRNN